MDVHVELLGGSSHDVDSNEQAFRIAAILAVKEAFREAGCLLLEPIMSMEVDTPDEFQGSIVGDLNRRRARITELEAKNELCVVRAEVPLATVSDGYATDLRSLSSGRASFSMTPSHFEEVPESVLDSIVERRMGVAA